MTVLHVRLVDMESLWLLVLLAAAAAASDPSVSADKPADIEYNCNKNTGHTVEVTGLKYPLYVCSTKDGGFFYVAADSEPAVKSFLDDKSPADLRDLVLSVDRPKRQFGGGYGGYASHSRPFTGGSGLGGVGGPGFGPPGFGGGYNSEQSPSFGGGGGRPISS